MKEENNLSFNFKKPQKTYTVCKTRIGGQPGENPTFMVGSVFWLGQKLVEDPNRGFFDQKAAENIIDTMQTQSDVTGVGFGFDVVGTTEEAFEKYINFMVSHTDAPLILDAMSPNVRMAAAKLVNKMGLADRCIYNSVYKGESDAELGNLKECGIKSAIVLANNPSDNSLEGKAAILQEALVLAEKAGVTQPFIDTAIPAFAPDMGSAVRALGVFREKYGFPTGLGSGNVVTTMGWIRANIAKEYRKGAVTASNTIMQMAGANYLMFGPAEQAQWVFPAAAVTDIYLASAAADFGVQPQEQTHPIYKAFL